MVYLGIVAGGANGGVVVMSTEELRIYLKE